MFFTDDKILPPSVENDKVWNDKLMLEHMQKISIPKFLSLFDRFPKPAFGSIGISKDPVNRWSNYVGHAEIFKKSESTPRVTNNELILFSCWSKKDALRYEYLMQHHTIQKGGKFFNLLGHRMNPQFIREPKVQDIKREPYHVYCQFSRSPFSLSKSKSDHPLASLAVPSTSTTSSSKKSRSRVSASSSSESKSKPKKKN
jgi:hypothetical protein